MTYVELRMLPTRDFRLKWSNDAIGNYRFRTDLKEAHFSPFGIMPAMLNCTQRKHLWFVENNRDYLPRETVCVKPFAWNRLLGIGRSHSFINLLKILVGTGCDVSKRLILTSVVLNFLKQVRELRTHIDRKYPHYIRFNPKKKKQNN